TTGARASVVLDGHTVAAFGFRPVRGRVLPAVTKGRWPSRANEIAVGAHTLQELEKSVGDTVRAHAPQGRAVALKVVGVTSLPSLALNGTYGVGEGAALTARGLRHLDAAASPSFVLVNLSRGVDLLTVHRRYRDVAGALGPQRPADIQSYAHVRSTPL